MPRVRDCTSVGGECTIENTAYGYYPNFGANLFFAVVFGVFLVLHLAAGIRWKGWIFTAALSLGCLAECIGYIGRVIMNGNPYSSAGFEMQICCLILAPAFLAAGVYLTLKHVTINLGSEHSRLSPRYYTWIFITCDFISLLLQAIGGATAATAKIDSLLKTGGNIMLAGIVFQVVTLLVFLGLAIEYFVRLSANRASMSESATNLLHSNKFRSFLAAVSVAFLTIFVRCLYRIAEMAGGWANPIMRNETEFLVFDGVMCLLAAFSLTLFHPGFFFPQMLGKTAVVQNEKTQMESSQANLEVGMVSATDRY